MQSAPKNQVMQSSSSRAKQPDQAHAKKDKGIKLNQTIKAIKASNSASKIKELRTKKVSRQLIFRAVPTS